MKALAGVIMRGKAEAAMVASTFAMLALIFPPLSFLSTAAVGLVTLRNGIKDGLVVTTLSILATSLLCLLIANSFGYGVRYGAGLWLPAVLCGYVLRETRSFALAVETLLLFGGGGVVLFYIMVHSPSELWLNVFQPLLSSINSSGVSADDFQQLLKAIALVSHYMTGLIATAIVMMFLMSLVLARWWQSLLYNPGGFRAEFLELKPHRPVAYISMMLVVVALLTSGVFQEVMANLAILPIALYLIVGTAVLHQTFNRMRMRVFLLSLLYVSLILIPHVVLPVAAIGFLDSWFNWRKNRSPDSTNS